MIGIFFVSLSGVYTPLVSLTSGKIKSPKSEASVRIRSLIMPPVVFLTKKHRISLFNYISRLTRSRGNTNYVFYGRHFENPNGGYAGVYANANINFWIPHALKIPKMYIFSKLQKYGMKNIVNQTNNSSVHYLH